MTHPALTFSRSQARLAERRRRAPATHHGAGPPEPPLPEPLPVTIRFAGTQDAAALAALAQLDSAGPLALPALIAEVDGELRAALSLRDAAVIADPFRPTTALVELLRTRAGQLASAPRSGLLARLRARRTAGALGVQLRG